MLSLSAHAVQYPDSAKSTETTITVHIVWMPTYEAVDKACSALGNTPPEGTIVGCYHPASKTIFAVEPANFNDYPKLVILGHEFWHALGAEHP